MQKLKTISIVIPVYNERNFIKDTLQKITTANSLGLRKEIIVVDDGSKDGTVEIIKNFIKTKNNNAIIKPLLRKKNQGKGATLKMGFQNTTGDIVIVLDADLEYSPDDLHLMISPFIKSGADVVYGSRLSTTEPHRVLYYWHYVINKLLTTFSNVLTNLTLTDMETGYKAFKGDLIRKIAPKLESKRFGFEPEITARISKIKGIKIFEVGVSYSGRTYEQGKKSLGKMEYWQ